MLDDYSLFLIKHFEISKSIIYPSRDRDPNQYQSIMLLKKWLPFIFPLKWQNLKIPILTYRFCRKYDNKPYHFMPTRQSLMSTNNDFMSNSQLLDDKIDEQHQNLKLFENDNNIILSNDNDNNTDDDMQIDNDDNKNIEYEAGNDNNKVSLINFTKGRLISQGNCGEVFAVYDQNDGSEYAAKSFYMDYKEYSKKARMRISKHMFIIKQLKFPSIMRVYDYSTNGFSREKRQTVLLEYCSYESLDHVLESNPEGFGDTQKLIILYGIAKGLKYIHSHGICHYDLKPSSIMINEDFHPKISNIGFSNHFYGIKEMGILKDFSIYTAPEVLIEDKFSNLSEIYSFAIIIYIIISNKNPFENISQYHLLEKLYANWRPSFDDSFPLAYRDLIEKCWLQNPNDRLSIDEICDQLEKNEFFFGNLDKKDEYIRYVESIKKFEEENKPYEQIIMLEEDEDEKKPKKLKKKKKGKKSIS